jgi:hypothetical protein
MGRQACPLTHVSLEQLRLDVSAKGGGSVLATFADNSLQVLAVRLSLLHAILGEPTC